MYAPRHSALFLLPRGALRFLIHTTLLIKKKKSQVSKISCILTMDEKMIKFPHLLRFIKCEDSTL